MRGCVAGSHAAEVLKDGDLVLAVNGQPVTSYGHVEGIVAACSLAARPILTPPYPPQSSTAPQENPPQKSLIADVTSTSGSGLKGSNSREGKAGATDEANLGDIGQPEPAVLIKAARPGSARSESQQGILEMPQVLLTIFRAPRVEEVRVQLGSEDGLGTCRLIHWCGAMFQVTPSFTACDLF